MRFGPALAVHRFVLGNGLRVLLCEDHGAPVISVHTWVNVGSRFEARGKSGLSHLFEHLMFGETNGYAHGAFDRRLEEAGAESNAATFLDWTMYHESLPRDALPLVLDLEVARFAGLALRDDTVASEKEVVSNERRQRVDDDVDGAVSELLWTTAFPTHGYGIPTIGFMDDIASLTTDDCRRFYATYYSPNNIALVLVGDLEPLGALALVQERYGLLAPSELPVEDVRPEPPQTTERRLHIQKPTETHKVAVGYRGPALGDFDHAPLVVLNEILFGGRASRGYRRFVHEKELATEVRGWVGTFRDPSLYDLYLVGRDAITADTLLAELDAMLAEVVTAPVSEAELERAKARLELGALQGLDTASGKAEQIGFYELVLGDPGALYQRIEATRRVTRADVLRAARRVLDPNARTVILVAPDGTAAGEGDEGDGDEDDDLSGGGGGGGDGAFDDGPFERREVSP
jgi:zinc protease